MKNHTSLFFSLYFFVLMLLLNGVMYAQISGIKVSGKVIDKTTQFNLPSVKIVVSVTGESFSDSTLSDGSGNWQLTIPVTSAKNDQYIPTEFSVAQNYPNPFNPSTRIAFQIPDADIVILSVFNTLGELIDKKEQFLGAGAYQVDWNAHGNAGIYFYRVQTSKGSMTKKMVLLDGSAGTGFSEIRAGAHVIPDFVEMTALPIRITASKSTYVDFVKDTLISSDFFIPFELETIHSSLRMIDLHNDVLEIMLSDTSYHLANLNQYNHTDIPRLMKGGVDAQFFAVWVNPTDYPANPFAAAQMMLNRYTQELNQNPLTIAHTTTADGILAANSSGKIAALLGVEGGHTIEEDLNKLGALYDAGMRYMTITWNNSTSWAVSAQDSRSATVGLNDFGRQVIRAMDSLGIIIDVSHTGIKTIEDILSVSANPIIATHSGVRAIRDHKRNLYDNQITAIAQSGGLIGIVFYPPFLSSGSANIAKVIEHIDYIKNLVGINHIAIGSDFDGIGTNTVVGLENVSKFPALTAELIKRGYSTSDLEKILGGNMIRVMQTVQANKK